MSATAAPAATASGLAAPSGDWKKLSAAMTAEVPAIAGHPVPVACTPGAGQGAPACHIPSIPVIEVDGSLLGADPATCDPASPSDRERYPATWGALIHECAHAAHSTEGFLPHADRANWTRALMELEESRIEASQVTRRPGDRRWLRACATKIILDDFINTGAEPGTPREAGTAAALLLAREDAGILEPAETARVTAEVEAAIGPGALARLRATWREAHATADGDLKAMTRLARRWCRILGLDPDAAPPAPVETGLSDLLDAIRDAIEQLGEAVAGDFAPPPPPFPPGTMRKREEEKQARSTASQAARETFGRKTPPPAVTGTREARDGEAAAARHLARALREATAGGRDTVTTTSKVPPGRLKMGKALASRAQRAAGAVPTAEPFTRTASRRVPAPPLRLGIACDISGTMSGFTAPVASAAWILARAAGHVPSATTATVLFGEEVHALTWPGQTPARVTDFRAPDGTERFCRAIDALDGQLGLSQPGTARLLVIVSDTFYSDEEIEGGQKRISRLARTGCGIIILRPADGWRPEHEWTDCQVIDIDDPAGTAGTIARAATRALTR
jgi:hypothetical protein